MPGVQQEQNEGRGSRQEGIKQKTTRKPQKWNNIQDIGYIAN